MSLNVAVVGAGEMGMIRLDALAHIQTVQIAAVCDSDPELAESAALEWGGTPYINHRTMLEREELDALFICVPPFAHADIETLAAQEGINLFVERPIALTIERASQIAEEIDEAGIITAVGYTWRYLSGVDDVKEKIGDGKIALASGVWLADVPAAPWLRQQERSGGLLVEQTSDIIDLARYFCGEVERLFAIGSRGIAPAKCEDCTIDDADAMVVRFHMGTAGSFIASCLAPADARNSLTLYTGAGSFTIDALQCEFVEPGRRTFVSHADDAIDVEVQTFINAIETGERSLIRSDYRDALNTLKVSLAAARGIESRKVADL